MNNEANHESLPKVSSGQQLLFSLHPRDLCRDLGLNWWAAMKLYEDGLLSFNPDEVSKLDEGQEAEIRFLAALITGDCGPRLITELLQHLPKPFRYRHSDIYYDWQSRRWRPLPTADEPEAVFADWLETLLDSADREAIESLRTQLDDTLQALNGSRRE